MAAALVINKAGPLAPDVAAASPLAAKGPAAGGSELAEARDALRTAAREREALLQRLRTQEDELMAASRKGNRGQAALLPPGGTPPVAETHALPLTVAECEHLCAARSSIGGTAARGGGAACAELSDLQGLLELQGVENEKLLRLLAR